MELFGTSGEASAALDPVSLASGESTSAKSPGLSE